MATFDEVRTAIRSGRYRVTDHAADEIIADDLTRREVVEATLDDDAEVIENYQKSKPNPSCLVLLRLADEDPVHAVWAFDVPKSYAVLRTVYRPDPARWSADFRKRVKR